MFNLSLSPQRCIHKLLLKALVRILIIEHIFSEREPVDGHCRIDSGRMIHQFSFFTDQLIRVKRSLGTPQTWHLSGAPS